MRHPRASREGGTRAPARTIGVRSACAMERDRATQGALRRRRQARGRRPARRDVARARGDSRLDDPLASRSSCHSGLPKPPRCASRMRTRSPSWNWAWPTISFSRRSRTEPCSLAPSGLGEKRPALTPGTRETRPTGSLSGSQKCSSLRANVEVRTACFTGRARFHLTRRGAERFGPRRRTGARDQVERCARGD